jgi:hypothetical protein
MMTIVARWRDFAIVNRGMRGRLPKRQKMTIFEVKLLLHQLSARQGALSTWMTREKNMSQPIKKKS